MWTPEERGEFVLPGVSVLTACSQGWAPSGHQWQEKVQQEVGGRGKLGAQLQAHWEELENLVLFATQASLDGLSFLL